MDNGFFQTNKSPSIPQTWRESHTRHPVLEKLQGEITSVSDANNNATLLLLFYSFLWIFVLFFTDSHPD